MGAINKFLHRVFYSKTLAAQEHSRNAQLVSMLSTRIELQTMCEKYSNEISYINDEVLKALGNEANAIGNELENGDVTNLGRIEVILDQVNYYAVLVTAKKALFDQYMDRLANDPVLQPETYGIKSKESINA